ncbi:hypothetical protein barba126A_phanotate83 [Rheinheimera phage vB_RspM_barba_12-6A]|jgi:hypothetical protein|uniref:Uncharacterized protein n=11 Tax=Barbavirus TaxID=2733095 RepID=A0A4P8ND47_9CAUD|nr:hypothetical protein HOV44_gp070 [Rheinheimera phage Barba5S]YP_009823086.1 hypothetical protein HOV47_gp073 [Rheinheimera phage vB_RspM_Barba19A]YP_009823221.1 hypothetical protein HOV48_gp065 [Rheinheimera phage Barba21A]QCQ58459.1 hypothetical protein Barba3A_gp065 [Rheinheimera phage vB_RspM_Barba3A]QCQ61077.1 hypothetical protein Barba15A_gp068 [Rheinheimera phage vB_RspM_Barba15A]QCQ61631.1 hypothetical protein Barba17S_gp068 [Rheinheimera phage vB_RspM_Barba17S]QCQ62187.1 hypothetic
MKFEVELKQVVHVEFKDLELAEKYFVGEDAEHATVFFESEHLSEVAKHLSYTFNLCSTYYEDGKWMKFIEGFDKFIRHEIWTGDCWTWQFISDTDEYGVIILIEEQELEVDYVQEIK